MQGSYIWNKHSLFRHQIVLVLCMLCGTALQAQHFKWARQHNPNYDDRKFSYGFSIGLHTTTYQVNYSDQFVTKKYDTVSAVLPQFIPGFSLGFLVNWRLNELLDLRIMPKAGFYSHRLTYYYTNRSTQSQLIETTMVELPILIKFKSMRRGICEAVSVHVFLRIVLRLSKNTCTLTASQISLHIEQFFGLLLRQFIQAT